jgi:hypothetical protein
MTINGERIHSLRTVLESYAETPEDKQFLIHFTNRNQTTDKEIILELVNAIHDGLAYGNWPWVVAKMNKR